MDWRTVTRYLLLVLTDKLFDFKENAIPAKTPYFALWGRIRRTSGCSQRASCQSFASRNHGVRGGFSTYRKRCVRMATCLLAHIHGCIRDAEQAVSREAVLGIKRDANTCGPFEDVSLE